VDVHYWSVCDYACSAKDSHSLSPFNAGFDADNVTFGSLHFHAQDFFAIARYVLNGGDFGYQRINPEVLAARQAVQKVCRDDALWRLVEQDGVDGRSGRPKSSPVLGIIGSAVGGNSSIEHLADALKSWPNLEDYVRTNYFGQCQAVKSKS